jgi:hypothetical protein
MCPAAPVAFFSEGGGQRLIDALPLSSAVVVQQRGAPSSSIRSATMWTVCRNEEQRRVDAAEIVETEIGKPAGRAA